MTEYGTVLQHTKKTMVPLIEEKKDLESLTDLTLEGSAYHKYF